MPKTSRRCGSRHSTIDAILHNLQTLVAREDWDALDLDGKYYLDYHGAFPPWIKSAPSRALSVRFPLCPGSGSVCPGSTSQSPGYPVCPSLPRLSRSSALCRLPTKEAQKRAASSLAKRSGVKGKRPLFPRAPVKAEGRRRIRTAGKTRSPRRRQRPDLVPVIPR